MKQSSNHVLSQVSVQLAVLCVSLQKLALYEALDAFLNHGGVWQEAARQLARDLSDDGVVV